MSALAPALACLNGEILPADEAKVPIWDRGFLFGDSIYEVLRLYRGRMWQEPEHFARLSRSLEEMRFAAIDLVRLRDRIETTIRESAVAEGTVYIQITRGVAPRLHRFPDPSIPPTELIVVRPYDDAPTARLRETGAKAVTRPDWRWGRCDVKSTNLLANVLANDSAHHEGAYEAIFVDGSGHVTEASHSSLLWVRSGHLEATPEGPEILPGTTRQGLPEIAVASGIPFREARVTLPELLAADEVLLTATTIEVLPVVSIDGSPIGDGTPGPVARGLQKAFRDQLSRWLDRA